MSGLPPEEALDRFNFPRVQRAMRAAGIRWTDAQGRRYLPGVHELRDRLRGLMARMLATGLASGRDAGFCCRHYRGLWFLSYEVEALLHEDAPEPEPVDTLDAH